MTKIILELEITSEEFKELDMSCSLKEYLEDSLFDICEGWVTGHGRPELIFKEE